MKRFAFILVALLGLTLFPAESRASFTFRDAFGNLVLVDDFGGVHNLGATAGAFRSTTTVVFRNGGVATFGAFGTRGFAPARRVKIKQKIKVRR